MKQFEPRYRLVRYGFATKVEKASRQQRMYTLSFLLDWMCLGKIGLDGDVLLTMMDVNRQAEEEPSQGITGDGEDEAGGEEEEIRNASGLLLLCGLYNFLLASKCCCRCTCISGWECSTRLAFIVVPEVVVT